MKTLRASCAFLMATLLCVSYALPQASWALDFNSPDKSATAQADGVIIVNGQSVHVTAGTPLTVAESAALTQYLTLGGQQPLLLGPNGTAIGGSVVLNGFGANLNGLLIPYGVTVINDFGGAANLNLAGNMINFGSFYGVSSNHGVTTGNIYATNIYNSSLISSMIPSQASLFGLNNLVSNFSLALNATNSIVNSGTIQSAGALSMIANSITNSATIAAVNNISLQAQTIANTGSIMSALGNLSIATSTLTNAGLLQAQQGTLSMTALQDSLDIIGTGGTFSAKNIIASVMGDGASTSSRLSINGGNFQSETLDLSSKGALNVNANSITGAVAAKANSVLINAQSGDLTVTSLDVSGDPVISAAGNVTIPGAVNTAGADYVVLAGGNINGGAVTINTVGGKVQLASGVTFSITNPGCIVCVQGTDYQITGTSGLGSINLAGSTINTGGGTFSAQSSAGGNIALGSVNTGGNTLNINSSGSVTTGALTAVGQTANVTAGSTITMSQAGSYDFTSTRLALNAPGAKTITSTAGNMTFGANSVTATGAGTTTFNTNAGTMDFRPAIAANSTAVTTAGPLVFNAQTVNMNQAGSVTFSSGGNLGSGFYTSTAINAGTGGIQLPAGSLTINSVGGGIELEDNRATATFPSNWTINSAGDILIEVNNFDNSGGSLSMNTPNSAPDFVSEIVAYGTGAQTFNNISNTGGTLTFLSDGRMTFNGLISNSNNSGADGGILAISGALFAVNAPNTQTGIVVNGTMVSNGGFISLQVQNTDTTTPANPALPAIQIDGTVTSVGQFLNGSTGLANGGGVELLVNTLPPGTLSSTQLALRPTTAIAVENGTITFTGVGSTTSNGATQYGNFGTAGTIAAKGGGTVTMNNFGGTVPGLIDGLGNVYADGGIIYISGASYAGEIRINGVVQASLPYTVTATPPTTTTTTTTTTPPPTTTTTPPVIDPKVVEDGFIPAGGAVISTDTVPITASTATLTTPTSTGTTATTLAPGFLNTTGAVVIPSCSIAVLQPPSTRQKKMDNPPMIMAFNEAVLSTESLPSSEADSEDMKVSLQKGRILAVTSDSGKLLISCSSKPSQTITVPKRSAVIVELTDAGSVSVAALDGPGASVQFASNSAAAAPVMMEVAPNTNIAFSADEEELIPIDAEAEVVVEAKLVQVDNRPIIAQSRSIKNKKRFMYRDQDPCSIAYSRDRDITRLRRKMQDIEQITSNPTKDPGPVGTTGPVSQRVPSAKSPFRPVAYTTPAPGQSDKKMVISGNSSFQSIATDSGIIRSHESAQLKVHEAKGVIDLERGEILFTADKETTIQAGASEVKVQPGAMVLVIRKGDHVRVTNLWESGVKDVRVTAGKSNLALAAGHEAIITEPGVKPYDVVKKIPVARREVRIFDNDKQGIMVSDVSLQTVLYESPVLKALAAASDGDSKKISERVIKMAAILSVATTGHGSYVLGASGKR